MLKKKKKKKDKKEGRKEREGDRPSQSRFYNLMWPVISISLETIFHHM